MNLDKLSARGTITILTIIILAAFTVAGIMERIL